MPRSVTAVVIYSLTSILKMAKTYKLGHCGDHELILKKNEQGLYCAYFCDNKNLWRAVHFIQTKYRETL